MDEYTRCLKCVIAGHANCATPNNSRLDLLSGAIIGMLQGLQLWGNEGVRAPLGDQVEQMTRMINGAIGAATA
ncbi:hypothetical protein D3C81_2060890 [compost metagenome]